MCIFWCCSQLREKEKMNQFEEEFNQQLKEIRSELKSLNLDWLLGNCKEYYNLENLISRIEKRGIKAEKQREELSQFVGKVKEQFEKKKLRESAQNYIKNLDNKIEKINYDKIKSSLISAIKLSDEFCNKNQIEGKNIGTILFEDWSGYGNLLMYGFSNKENASEKFNKILIDGIEEIDMTDFYVGMKEIEVKERKLPITIISEKLIEYSDTAVRLILSKSLKELYGSNWTKPINKDSICFNQLEFYHNHHDAIEVMIYQKN